MEYATDATDARVINETTPLTQISNRNIQICLAGIKFSFHIQNPRNFCNDNCIFICKCQSIFFTFYVRTTLFICHLLLCEMDTYNPSILGIGQKNGTRNRY